ncbi:MAG: hypothetical protein MUE44_12105 [Oscillatoriaceae cyanobacterium Prado104]|jgi:hypothetical protein|nr:hypothetical protein [Oscillatoriaceae cyanobacterium Prado104]
MLRSFGLPFLTAAIGQIGVPLARFSIGNYAKTRFLNAIASFYVAGLCRKSGFLRKYSDLDR